MDTTTIFLYVVAVSAVTIIPGPTTLLALSNGATGGFRLAACGMLGAALSDLILIGAVGLGLGAILQASTLLFEVVKWIGALYLLYLAWSLWRAPTALVASASTDAVIPRSGRSAFLRSLLVALSNPKGLLFFSAFLPQFIQTGFSVATQYITFALLTAIIDIALMSLYAIGGYHAVRVLSGGALRWLNRSCAAVLAGLAAAMTLYRRSRID
ncbi:MULTISPECIES: LysE family translocator [Achromobacter]|uniref:LysE family translocator n=1 Tax=Achromobacter spanius TaxID=217203 RepID=A0ABY8GLX2_9BURK|nr:MULTISPECIES: LysE family translocator [Achromobacter]WAI84915.1 LysE family translocator [Achromobacter spanius]WEX94999.1 LysE family translocator [Achromobacter sp. SS2-2022]WFP05833.1 LysE family translocator [Achromobacter spanius]